MFEQVVLLTQISTMSAANCIFLVTIMSLMELIRPAEVKYDDVQWLHNLS